MAPGQRTILIVGGSGVFGRLLAGELLSSTMARLVLGGRRLDRVAAACRALGDPERTAPLALDLSEPGALANAASGCFAVACAAGPFQALPRELPATAAAAAGAHWLDLADDPGWVLPLLDDRSLAALARAADRAVMPGLSTVPALSGALVRWCRQRLPSAGRARLTLFIGNRSPKGAAAIASVLGAGFAYPEPVVLPLGRHLAYRFDSPDAALLRRELGLRAEFRVAFEWRAANWLVAALAPLGLRLSARQRTGLARWLAAVGGPMSRSGSDLGCLQAELWDNDGRSAAAALVGGQRMAILPCALAVEALLAGELHQGGVLHPASWLEPDDWMARLQARGLEFSAAVPRA